VHTQVKTCVQNSVLKTQRKTPLETQTKLEIQDGERKPEKTECSSLSTECRSNHNI